MRWQGQAGQTLMSQPIPGYPVPGGVNVSSFGRTADVGLNLELSSLRIPLEGLITSRIERLEQLGIIRSK